MGVESLKKTYFQEECMQYAVELLKMAGSEGLLELNFDLQC